MAGVQTLEKGQNNIKRKKKRIKWHIFFLITRGYEIRYTYDFT